MATYILIYSLVVLGILLSYRRDINKTQKALRLALKMAVGLAPSFILILGLIGLVLGLLPGETISTYLGPQAGGKGLFSAAVIGSVIHIPSLMAFPLAGSIYAAGAGTATVAVFITTLVMVGFVTAPLEGAQLGRRFMLARNGLSFVGALLIAWLMGVILG